MAIAFELLNFIFSKKITLSVTTGVGRVFFKSEKSRKVDSYFSHAVSLHRHSEITDSQPMDQASLARNGLTKRQKISKSKKLFIKNLFTNPLNYYLIC